MPRSKVSAFLSVLLVFLSGAAMGAVGYRLYSVKSVPNVASATPPKKSPDDFRKMILNQLKDTVKLDQTQLDEVQKVYRDQYDSFMQVKSKYDSRIDEIHKEAKVERDQIHDASVAKIKAILHPDQLPLYEKWQAARAAEREADHKRRQQQQREHPEHPEGKRPPMPYPLP